MKSPFAQNMVKARKYYGLSQVVAARLLNINRSSLGSYEEGRAEPSFEVLIRICIAYQINDIISFVSDPKFNITKQKANPEKRLSIIELAYSKLNGKVKEAVNVLLELQ